MKLVRSKDSSSRIREENIPSECRRMKICTHELFMPSRLLFALRLFAVFLISLCLSLYLSLFLSLGTHVQKTFTEIQGYRSCERALTNIPHRHIRIHTRAIRKRTRQRDVSHTTRRNITSKAPRRTEGAGTSRPTVTRTPETSLATIGGDLPVT